MPYTSLLTEDQLVADEVLRLTPGIYQSVVSKDHELRVTMVGRRALAARVLSQETQSGRTDWRQSYHELRFEAVTLDPGVAEMCFEMMTRLGVVFGCFDLIVTPKGEHVFLEINEMGQFLFVERATGLPLVDCVAEFLRQGSVDFEWDETRPRIRYSEISEEVLRLIASASRLHVSIPDGFTHEDAPEAAAGDGAR
jgi:hypothetical protein